MLHLLPTVAVACSIGRGSGGVGGMELEEAVPTMSAENHSQSASEPASSGAARAAPELAGNRLLAGLPGEETERLRAVATRERWRMRQVLYEQNGAMESVYFPQDGVFSQLVEMADGGIIEVLTIGSEGMIGLPAVMGATRSPIRAMCQIGGWAIRIPTSALIQAASRDGVLFDRLTRYAQAQMTSLTRSVACNRLHSPHHLGGGPGAAGRGTHPLRPGPPDGGRPRRSGARRVRVLRRRPLIVRRAARRAARVRWRTPLRRPAVSVTFVADWR